MQAAINDEQNKHTALYEEQDAECNAEFVFRNNEINDARAAFESSQASLARCSNAEASSKNDLEKAENYVTKINSILSDLAA